MLLIIVCICSLFYFVCLNVVCVPDVVIFIIVLVLGSLVLFIELIIVNVFLCVSCVALVIGD